jgi:hypothetical protein
MKMYELFSYQELRSPGRFIFSSVVNIIDSLIFLPKTCIWVLNRSECFHLFLPEYALFVNVVHIVCNSENDALIKEKTMLPCNRYQILCTIFSRSGIPFANTQGSFSTPAFNKHQHNYF